MKMKSIVIACILTVITAVILTATPAMDLDYLTKSRFKTCKEPGWKFPDWGEEIVFKQNGTYTQLTSGNGGMFKYKGTFILSGNAVDLKSDKNYEINYDGAGQLKEQDSRYKGVVVLSCTIKETPDDLYSENHMACVEKQIKTSTKYHPDHAAVKAGSQRNFKGIPVVTMGMAKGVTTTSVKIRETPSVTGKALTYALNPYDPTLPSVPDKTPVTIIARTKEKEKVQNWNNYWYLVNVGMFTPEVWMFGEFVKMK